MADKILIRGLEFWACHGVKSFEKVTPQPFVFDADICYDFCGAYFTDDLKDTINYSEACKIIGGVVRNNCFNLIEKLAYGCAYELMDKLPAEKVTLTVYKPQAPVKQKFSSVGVTVEVERNTVYLSLGSSIGDRKKYLDKALGLLDAPPFCKIKKVSSVIETEPVGGVAENKFLNCAAEAETLYSPERFLEFIQTVERECGRQRTVRWGDRTLDVDVIFFGNKIIRTPKLIVPHPAYSSRDFVLTPLKEIAPDFVCPLSGKAVKEL